MNVKTEMIKKNDSFEKINFFLRLSGNFHIPLGSYHGNSGSGTRNHALCIGCIDPFFRVFWDSDSLGKFWEFKIIKNLKISLTASFLRLFNSGYNKTHIDQIYCGFGVRRRIKIKKNEQNPVFFKNDEFFFFILLLEFIFQKKIGFKGKKIEKTIKNPWILGRKRKKPSLKIQSKNNTDRFINKKNRDVFGQKIRGFF